MGARNDILDARRVVQAMYSLRSSARDSTNTTSRSALLCLIALCGCTPSDTATETSLARLDAVWGRRGLGEGRLQKPRAMAIDQQGQLYLVDMTARIQVFDRDGKFLRGWQTPEHTNGRPTGLSFDRQGRLLMADTHYFRVLIYSPTGELLETFGGEQGHEPGQFGLVTDAVQDREGNYYVAEYGEYDRIQKLSPQGEFILEWGGHGSAPGQFRRPQGLCLDQDDHLWVADACNHRLQEFDNQGKLLRHWGSEGPAPGQLSYPYDVVCEPDGRLLVCEYGNNRIQRFTADGQSLGVWGAHGRQPGQMHNPWSVVVDGQGTAFVLDTNNHRVQRLTLKN